MGKLGHNSFLGVAQLVHSLGGIGFKNEDTLKQTFRNMSVILLVEVSNLIMLVFPAIEAGL